MYIKSWGARGSIPVSGRTFNKYGGDTPCLEVRSKNGAIIIVDAGSGIRRLGNDLLTRKKRKLNMLFTHAHWDHVLGFPFFKLLYFSRTDLNVYGCPFAQGTIKTMLATTMAAPNFPLDLGQVKAKLTFHGACKGPFTIDSIRITPILLSHPNKGLGYKFEEDGKTFVFLTDNELGYQHEGGLLPKDYLAFSTGADLLIHDAEFTQAEYKLRRTWGHSTYDDALELALAAGVKKFGLYHHNQDRPDKDIDAIVKDCRAKVRAAGKRMECFGVVQDYEIEF